MLKTHCIRGHLLSDKNVRVYKHKGGWRNRVCKKCLAITNKKFHLKNPNYNKKWRAKNPGWYKPEKKRESDLRKKYGIDTKIYNQLLEKQLGKCAICVGKPGGRWDTFVVDHNHSTGKVRGLLCLKCNRAIGLIRDDIEIAKRIVEYLDADKWRNRK